MNYPAVLDPALVGTYSPVAKAGGGYVWDEVLEYRVWCHPARGAEDLDDGGDYYYAFASYAEAAEFSGTHSATEKPLALILQREYLGHHGRVERIAEWPVEFLRRPSRTARTIPDLLSPSAPSNRLEILRGLA